MIIYLVNRSSKLGGPFDIIDPHHEHIINVGDICLLNTSNGLAFLLVNTKDNAWDSCFCVGLGNNNDLLDIDNTLLFSYDNIHQRKGNILLIKKLLPCFREKVIVKFFDNAIDILQYKRDSWDLTLFQQFFSPTKELIDVNAIENRKEQSKTDDDKTSPTLNVEEVKTDVNSPYIESSSSNKENRKLIKRYQKGDRKAYEMLIINNMRLVAYIANGYRNQGVDYEDLKQEGVFGLVQAIDHYEPKRKTPFSFYANWWINHVIKELLYTMPLIVRIPMSQLALYRKVRRFIERYEQENVCEPSYTEIEIEENVDLQTLAYLSGLPDNILQITSYLDNWDDYPDSDSSADELLLKESTAYRVDVLLNSLKERDATIIRGVYGIGTEEKSLSTIGDILGLTQERVRQIKEKVIRKELRPKLNIKEEKKVAFVDEGSADSFVKDKQESVEIEETTLEMIERIDNLQSSLKETKQRSLQLSSQYLKYKDYKIANNAFGCEIFNSYNSLVFNSKGKVKVIEGDLYQLSYHTYSLNIYLLEESDNRFYVGRRVVDANELSPLFGLINSNNYYEKIVSIRKVNYGHEYQVQIEDKWYNEYGFPLAKEVNETDSKEIIETAPKEEIIHQSEKKRKENAEIGDVLLINSKRCTVIDKKYGMIVVRYDDGITDHINNNSKKYTIINKNNNQRRK